jgi:hypothetical protein
MSARPAVAAAAAAFVLLLVVALGGCGGSSPSGSSSDGDGADAQALVRQTFGSNAAASSGLVSGTIDITATGVKGYTRPVELSMSGPFQAAAGNHVPEAHLALGIRLRDQIYGADMIFTGNDVLVALGPTAYQVPAALAATIRKPLADTGNPLGALLDVYAIAPGRWAANTKIAGNETLAGEEVVHATAGIDTKQFFEDAARFTRVLTSLRFTEIAGLPQVIDPKMRAALVRSVASSHGDLWVGVKDHVVRRARFDILVRPTGADRKLLGGAATLHLTGRLDVSDVGTPQHVDVPSERGSFKKLQQTFDALAESTRGKGT